MKRLLLLISFAILFLHAFTQTDVQRDNRASPILKQALASKSGYYVYGRSGTAGFINIAVLNQSSHTLCWFTCHGRLFDSTKLTNQEFDEVTSKQIDPFVLYQNICDKYLADIAAAKDIYRVYGDIQLFEKLNGNYRALFAMETVQAAKTRLQKLIAIENVRKKILTQLAYLNCVSPFSLQDAPLYKISKEQAGTMIQTKDSTVYYNIDPTSAVAKISLYKKSAGQLYIQNRFSEIIDSVAIQPEKYDLLQKEKTDVFLLYRGWLELQWQGTLAAIKRQSSGLFSQVNAQNEKEVKELYSQLNAIGAKINQLNSPETKSIEQAVYDTYKNEASEINYIPLLGIGYSMTQTRGQKEYELTNHLGNVLATVSDKKIGVSSASDSSLIDHYEADIVSAQDYYPFGMLQSGRSYLSPNGEKYRYGFNSKENDNEVKGEGNQQDYGMRVYDPRLGRFLSVDPLSKSYPWNSPYAFAENDVLRNIDLDGGEKKHFLLVWDEKQKYATLKYSHTEDFTETNTEWTPTWTDWTKTKTTTVKNPRIEYVVHGTVKVPMSADGMFADDVQPATWTFKSFEDMVGKENTRREEAKNPYGWHKDHLWDWITSDQRWDFTGNQIIMYGIEAQAQKTIYSPNVFTGLGKAQSITKAGLNKVRAHLMQFGVHAENKIMLERMNKIVKGELKATEIDLNFYKHELREMELMKKGMKYEEAHYEVLKEQGMYHPEYDKKLYTKEALEAGNKELEKD